MISTADADVCNDEPGVDPVTYEDLPALAHCIDVPAGASSGKVWRYAASTLFQVCAEQEAPLFPHTCVPIDAPAVELIEARAGRGPLAAARAVVREERERRESAEILQLALTSQAEDVVLGALGLIADTRHVSSLTAVAHALLIMRTAVLEAVATLVVADREHALQHRESLLDFCRMHGTELDAETQWMVSCIVRHAFDAAAAQYECHTLEESMEALTISGVYGDDSDDDSDDDMAGAAIVMTTVGGQTMFLDVDALVAAANEAWPAEAGEDEDDADSEPAVAAEPVVAEAGGHEEGSPPSPPDEPSAAADTGAPPSPAVAPSPLTVLSSPPTVSSPAVMDASVALSHDLNMHIRLVRRAFPGEVAADRFTHANGMFI